MKKDLIITGVIIVLVLILAYVIISATKPDPLTNESIAKCIGENSILYVQLGCHACEAQKELFGESYQKLAVVDCFYERDKCEEIRVTPTWKIKGKLIEGVQSIEKLKELTGC